MKFTIEIDSETNPDAVGEFLRSSFFDEKKIEYNEKEMEYGLNSYREVGCYSTFEWRPDVEPLEELPIDPDDPDIFEDMKWTRGQKDGIECRYYWDGDGVLAFKLPDGKWLVNTDCKKDHDWRIVESEDEL